MEKEKINIKHCTSVKVVRFDNYPPTDPKYLVVAFEVKCTLNDRRKYTETRVDLDAAKDKSEEEVTRMAWDAVKEDVKKWFKEEATKKPIIGSSFEIPDEDA